MMQAAREAADQFVRENETRSDYDARFLRTEDHGEEIWVVYKKAFRDKRLENPENVTIAYNKATGATRWVPGM